ncbi:MAG: hypothetical protein ACYC0F_20345, partial [Rhodanobacter sp.]
MAEYRAPRTRINEAFGQLAASNNILRQREEAAEAQSTNKFANTVGMVAGAATLAYTGGNVALASAAYTGASQLAGASRGREIDSRAVIGAAAVASGEMKEQDQLAAERETLGGIRADRDAAVSDSYATGDPVPARPEDRLMSGAMKSRTP